LKEAGTIALDTNAVKSLPECCKKPGIFFTDQKQPDQPDQKSEQKRDSVAGPQGKAPRT